MTLVLVPARCRERERGEYTPCGGKAGHGSDACPSPLVSKGEQAWGVGAPGGWHVLGSVTETKEGAVDVGNSAIHEGAKRAKEGPKACPARTGSCLGGTSRDQDLPL